MPARTGADYIEAIGSKAITVEIHGGGQPAGSPRSRSSGT